MNNDGGAAFPRTCQFIADDDWVNECGMTLRDYFAGKAMIAVIPQYSQFDDPECREAIGKRCYELAAAMLKARGAD